MLLLKWDRIDKIEGIILPDRLVIEEIDENGYKYIGILERDQMKEKETKELLLKEYKERLKLVLKTKLNGRNKKLAVNTCTIASLRWWSADVIEWRSDKLKELDRRPCEMCMKSEEKNLIWYVKNLKKILKAGARKMKVLNNDEVKEKGEFKQDRQNEALNGREGENVWLISIGNTRDS